MCLPVLTFRQSDLHLLYSIQSNTKLLQVLLKCWTIGLNALTLVIKQAKLEKIHIPRRN